MFKHLDTSVLGAVGPQSEVIEQALTHGFHSMDLNIVDFVNRAAVRGASYARRLIESSKLRIGVFVLPFKLDVDDEAFKKNLISLTEWASAAAELGCVRCVTAIEPAGDWMPYHENFTFHRDRLAEISGVLKLHGIRLGVGFRAAADLRRGKAFQFIHDPDATVLLVKMVNATNAGLLLDAWDWFVGGGSIETVRALSADRIVAVQLADAPQDVPLEELVEQQRLLPGVDGRFDLPAVLAALAEMNYDGPVSVKPHRGALPASGVDSVTKMLGQSLDAVWKAAGLNPKGRLSTLAGSAPA